MGKLYVVRHADAGHRVDGSRPDEQRELSERGWRQAEGLCLELAEHDITRLVASPFVRCLQTLEPLGKVLGLSVEADDRLAEGTGAAGALAVAAEVRETGAVLCSHGDVIPDLLEHLVARGARLKDELRWQKASTWVFSWAGDELAKGRYLPPPA
ncbi:MAG: SixA phosphatase family protein [Acidimicrobiales bacterium]